MKKLIYLLFFVILLFSCVNKVKIVHTGNYETKYIVHYSTYKTPQYTIYSDDSIYTCSFQGTNFLLEKNNAEEILSTTAPIEIIYCKKITDE